jgi:hypothetical protein
MTLDVYPLRFCFTAQDPIYFPGGKPGNIVRGAFGIAFKTVACVPECRDARACSRRAECIYARVFEPASAGVGPSGFTEQPRPFLVRAAHLDGCAIDTGQNFHFDLHLFNIADPGPDYFVAVFEELARQGLGPRRGRACLESVWQLDRGHEPLHRIYQAGGADKYEPVPPLSLSLRPRSEAVNAVAVEFTTPTELKAGDQIAARPEFAILFARIRDRISTLRALYGAGPLVIDFKGLGERAARIRMARCELEHVSVHRTSSRTGQTHSLGGFVGRAEYEGDLAEFVPYLEVAEWTGVGRQTVWGKGAIRVARK